MSSDILLGLCHAEFRVPGFRSGVRRTRVGSSAKLLTNTLRHRWCPLFAEDRADGDPKFRPDGNRPEYGVRRSEVGDRRSDGARVREDKEIDTEYGVTGVPKEQRYVTRYPN